MVKFWKNFYTFLTSTAGGHALEAVRDHVGCLGLGNILQGSCRFSFHLHLFVSAADNCKRLSFSCQTEAFGAPTVRFTFVSGLLFVSFNGVML